MKPDDWDAEEREALEHVRDEIETLRADHVSDPPIELLRAARAHALPDDMQSRVEGHLDASAWSRALVDGTDTIQTALPRHDEDRLLSRIQHEAARARKPATWRRLLLPILATAGMAAIAVVVVRRSWETVPEAPPATGPAVSIPAPAPPPVRTHLALEKPAIKLSPRALTYRGTGGDKDFLTAIKPALDALRADDYAAADRELTALAPRYPRSVEIPFYQGVARLFLGNLDGANAALASADQLADSSFASDVAWYRAVSDERAGRVADARARLDRLCKDRGNPRQSTACSAMERLK